MFSGEVCVSSGEVCVFSVEVCVHVCLCVASVLVDDVH